MKVVSFDQSQTKFEQDKRNMLEVLDEMRKRVESGEISELVAASLSPEGEAQIHVFVKDLAGGVGLYEIGKHLFISNQAGFYD